LDRLRLLAFTTILTCATAQASEQRYDSWQIRHPVKTGVVSALTLGVVPDHFGADVIKVSDYMEQGWTKATLEIIFPHSEKVYKNTKTILSFLEVLIALVLATRYARKKA
jgi:hypothetical protein